MQDSLGAKLLGRMHKTCLKYDLLAPNDRILVAISGGKDSYTLLTLLGELAQKVPFTLSLIAVHLDQNQPGYDGKALHDYLRNSGVNFEILSEDTYSVVREHIPEGGTYCSLCSRLRRGILYTAAERLGCNKIALGHHREDTLETFLMNLFYAGKLQAMPARYRTDDGRFEVIRPLIECAEDTIRAFAQQQNYPIIPCNLCGSQEGLRRDHMARLLTEMEQSHPSVRQVMLHALSNVRPSHLLDQEVGAAWAGRPTDIRPNPPPRASKKHAGALAILSDVSDVSSG